MYQKRIVLGMHDCIVRVDDMAFIPNDPANTDYQAYLAWVAEGNSPLPWPPEA